MVSPLVILGIGLVAILATGTFVSLSASQVQYAVTAADSASIQNDKVKEAIKVTSEGSVLTQSSDWSKHSRIKEVIVLDNNGTELFQKSIDAPLSAFGSNTIDMQSFGYSDISDKKVLLVTELGNVFTAENPLQGADSSSGSNTISDPASLQLFGDPSVSSISPTGTIRYGTSTLGASDASASAGYIPFTASSAYANLITTTPSLTQNTNALGEYTYTNGVLQQVNPSPPNQISSFSNNFERLSGQYYQWPNNYPIVNVYNSGDRVTISMQCGAYACSASGAMKVYNSLAGSYAVEYSGGIDAVRIVRNASVDLTQYPIFDSSLNTATIYSATGGSVVGTEGCGGQYWQTYNCYYISRFTVGKYVDNVASVYASGRYSGTFHNVYNYACWPYSSSHTHSSFDNSASATINGYATGSQYYITSVDVKYVKYTNYWTCGTNSQYYYSADSNHSSYPSVSTSLATSIGNTLFSAGSSATTQTRELGGSGQLFVPYYISCSTAYCSKSATLKVYQPITYSNLKLTNLPVDKPINIGSSKGVTDNPTLTTYAGSGTVTVSIFANNPPTIYRGSVGTVYVDTVNGKVTSSAISGSQGNGIYIPTKYVAVPVITTTTIGQVKEADVLGGIQAVFDYNKTYSAGETIMIPVVDSVLRIAVFPVNASPVVLQVQGGSAAWV